MKTYMRVLQHIHKSQNVSSLDRVKREIEAMFIIISISSKGYQCQIH